MSRFYHDVLGNISDEVLDNISDEMVDIIEEYLSSLGRYDKYSEYKRFDEMPRIIQLVFLEDNWEYLQELYK